MATLDSQLSFDLVCDYQRESAANLVWL